MKVLGKQYFLIFFTIVFVASFPFAVSGTFKKLFPENVRNGSFHEFDGESMCLGLLAFAENKTDISEDDNPENNIPEQKEPEWKFAESDVSYFDDALFIGDSRTVDLAKYGTLKTATYFADIGMSVYNMRKSPKEIPDLGKMTFDEALAYKKYGKIYIMLGLNELGYNMKQTQKKYEKLIEEIKETQPDAVIYILSNIHVTKECSETDPYSHNPDIDRFNGLLSELADEKTVFYLDINRYFDKDGVLDEKYTGDGTHFYAKYYPELCRRLCENTVKFN